MRGTNEDQSRRRAGHTREIRFEQLLAIAREGDEAAVADLWIEFGFQYGRDEE
jgi:hypothetical protein